MEPPKAQSRGLNSIVLLGTFGPPFLTAARSLSRAGVNVAVMEISDVQPKRKSSAVARVGYVPRSEVGTPAGLSRLCEFIKATSADALLPLSDTHLLWLTAHRHYLPSTCKLLAPEHEVLEFLLSKKNQIELARGCGFDVLPTWALSEPNDVSKIDSGAYPICLRPSDPEAVDPTFKVEIFRSASDLHDFVRGLKWDREPLLAQPFRPLPNLVVHGVRSESGRVLALDSFIVPMKFEGVALELRLRTADGRTLASCNSLAERLNIVGPFHFDLLYCPDTGECFYLEVNVRLGGTTDKVYKLGFDEPLLTAKAYGFEVGGQSRRRVQHRSVVNRRAVLKHIVWAAKGRLSELDYPVVSRYRYLLLSFWNLVWAKDSIASIRDLRGTLSFYLRGL